MPLTKSAQTGALLVATGLTAAGLNLGVMGIGDDEPTSTESVELAAAEHDESVELLDQAPTAQPVLLATVADDAPTAEAISVQPAQATASGTQAVANSAAHGDDGGSEDHESEDGESHDDGSEDHDESPDHDEDESNEAVTETTEPQRDPESERNTTTTETPATPTTQPTPTSGMPAPTIAPTTSPPETDTVITAAPSTEYLTYEFPRVATIIVALHDGEALEFWSATPAPGWVFRVDDNTTTTVKIKFRPLDGGDEAEWELNLQGGELKLKQEH